METTAKIRAGDVRSASRLIRDLEDKLPGARPRLKQLFQHTGKSFIIGITGAPGAGKSTLTDALIAEFRKQSKTVGVLAVDPTSPFSGGAILGDRIRMLKHTEDEGVFIRSLATRGALGGLSQAAGDAIHVMEAMGKDIILVETVGIGQQELDIIHHAHSVVVVLVPGMGDEIQTMKAGLMEIADVFAINKADRPGAKQLQSELTALLSASSLTPDTWKPPIVGIGNRYEPTLFAQQTAVLAQKIMDHHAHLILCGQLSFRMERQALMEISDALKACILEPVLRKLSESGELQNMTRRVKNRETDPYTEAETIAHRFLTLGEKI
ncbi:MAG: methylmalonyl Co-A mutase-associated GTPase MeaB [Syntrophaceae bacterium]|jgi:LAO/AO transport system kinase|nr:methylmalonyl Co-A mutase-associated GTPase MeaB [Syntrophaceae bacterium]HOC59213.1 methylmalonyl Co-A mutase-associated GTPase MeaB [Smithellaceae bacterium]HQM45251.1 methylmalonyl Co-A mutase-associated GTPase MeaB [Smithellaceae bacterium]